MELPTLFGNGRPELHRVYLHTMVGLEGIKMDRVFHDPETTHCHPNKPEALSSPDPACRKTTSCRKESNLGVGGAVIRLHAGFFRP